MALTETDYQQQLRQLLPPGPAFDLALQPDWAQIVAALAPELARVNGNGEALMLEMNPATATVLLPYWEGYLGLPDLCTVPGFSRYEASDAGEIRRAGSLRPIKQRLNDRGRPVLMVTDDQGRPRQVYVHRLVALAFHGEAEDGLEVCHGNGVRTDNRASNLRWDTHAENMRDKKRHEGGWSPVEEGPTPESWGERS